MDCICIILIVSAVGKYAEMIPESFRVGFFVCRNSSREEFSCLKQRAICGIQFIRRISNFSQTKCIKAVSYTHSYAAGEGEDTFLIEGDDINGKTFGKS